MTLPLTLTVRSPVRLRDEVTYICSEIWNDTNLKKIDYKFVADINVTMSLGDLTLEFDSEIFDSIISRTMDGYQFDKQIGLHKPSQRFKPNSWSNWLGTAFFMLTRAEEYGEVALDIHGRFLSSASIYLTTEQYEVPWVDVFRARLLNHFKLHDLRQGRTIATHDIDVPFRFEMANLRLNWHSLLRMASHVWRDKRLTCSMLADRADNLRQMHVENVDQIFFIMSNLKRHRLDGRYSLKSKKLKTRIEFLIEKGVKFGWHAEYDTLNSPKLAKQRIQDVREFLGFDKTQEIDVRAHFLKWDVRRSPAFMKELGVTTDYSMGFSDTVGFRAGTARPFKFFDIEKRIQTELRIVPLILMDCALLPPYRINDCEIDLFISRIWNIKECVKKYNGDFVFLWHNSYLETPTQQTLYKYCIEP